MALDLMQTQTLKLKMTPALYQSISLLQYNNQELYQFIREQALENPLLHIDDSPYVPPRAVDTSYQKGSSEKSRTDIIEETVTNRPDYRDNLFQQLQDTATDQKSKQAVCHLIDSLNDYGYLDESIALLSAALNIEEPILEIALEILQQFDPPGIGARNLQECLFLQLQSIEINNPLAETIVADYIDVFTTGDWAALEGQLGVSKEEIQTAVDVIKSLHPNPVKDMASDPVQYVVPDVTIKRNAQGFQCTIEDRLFPKLSIDLDYYKHYQETDDRQTHTYLHKKMDEAKWLLSSISKRKQTLLQVTEAVVDRQKDFLLDGVLENLRPLTLKMISDELGIHESTVSRTIKNKYIQTPQGLVTYKDWFVKGMRTSGGEGDISVHRIKSLIEQLIAGENPNKPLSDQIIVARLSEKGLSISRRAVAKYRSESGIPSSSKRKGKGSLNE